MAQTIAPQPSGPRLFPAFPNEIGNMILLNLSFRELLIGWFVSHAWRKFIDGNGELRKRMFRLRKGISAADQTAREEWVERMWDETILTVEGSTDRAFWGIIDINPVFKYVDRPSCAFYPCKIKHTVDDEALHQIAVYQQSRLKRLWRSIFITYPPVTKVKYCYMRNRVAYGPDQRNYGCLIRLGQRSMIFEFVLWIPEMAIIIVSLCFCWDSALSGIVTSSGHVGVRT